jgi:hypothetical protein
MGMAKRWQDMTPDEKTDQLRNEMMLKNNQVAVLSMQIQEIGQAVKAMEEKLKERK